MNRLRAIPNLAAVSTVALALVGCQAPRGPISVDSDDPDLKVQAIKRDAALHDERHEPELVRDLNDPDPAVRFYAAAALHRLTGNDFGYRYYDDDDARQPAVARWKAWVDAPPVR